MPIEPDEVDMDAQQLDRAVGLVRARGAVAQLCVRRHARVVLDVAVGCRPDALFWVFSAGKPVTAVLVHQLTEQGIVDLDAPVATYWPEFAQNGKRTISIRHVLAHRAGLPAAGTALGDALAMTSWDRSIRRIERARPRWRPGTVSAYSPVVSGFVLGELVRRTTGQPVPELLRTAILDPVGLTDTALGLSDEQWPRHVPVRVAGPTGPLVEAVVNRRATRQAVIPAAGLSTTARDLATFYQSLLDVEHGTPTGVLHARTLARALAPSSDGEIDRTIHAPIRWAQGFQLGGPRAPERAVLPLGTRSSPRTFGHNGSSCCIGWADPDRDVAYAYLTNRLTNRQADGRHLAAVADAVLAACR